MLETYEKTEQERGASPQQTIGAFERGLAGVAPAVLLEVRRVAELPAAVQASEARLVRVNQHVIVQGMLASEGSPADAALVRLNTCHKQNATNS